MSDPRTEVLAYLKAHGPSSPRVLLDKIGGTPRALTALLRKMKADKEVIAAGTTVNRVYGLPGQKLEVADAPAGKRLGVRKSKRSVQKPRRRVHKKARRVQRRPKRDKRIDFLPAITAQNEIVVFNGAAPVKYSAEQSRALADLVFANFTQ